MLVGWITEGERRGGEGGGGWWWGGGGSGRGLSASPKFSVNVPFFSKSRLNVPFLKEVTKKCTWKSILYTSKLKKHKTLLSIGFYLVENIKSESLFNNIEDTRDRIDD